MLAWTRQANESAKAFEAFELYRDMGSARSVTKVAQTLAKSRTLIGRWSSKHDWVDRIRALEARDAMIAREAVEEHLRAKAEDHGRREVNIRERGLAVREAAMTQAENMVKWPLAEQEVVREGPDGEDVKYVFVPSGWSKATAVSMFNMAMGSAPATPDAEPDEEFDFSNMTEEEMQTFLFLAEKLGIQSQGE